MTAKKPLRRRILERSKAGTPSVLCPGCHRPVQVFPSSYPPGQLAITTHGSLFGACPGSGRPVELTQ